MFWGRNRGGADGRPVAFWIHGAETESAEGLGGPRRSQTDADLLYRGDGLRD